MNLQMATRGKDPAELAGELFSRNAPIISGAEQTALHDTRVLVAGCGSVGGSAVEPLVRLGVGSLVLADPDRYELHNLNRQVCLQSDVGRLKVSVLAERIQNINPLVEVKTFPEGITEDTVDDALRGVSVVFEGIDGAGPSLWLKYLLHEHAATRRIPTIAGIDLGGKAVLFVFDYRRRPRPYYGKGDREAFRTGNEAAATRSWLGVWPLPRDFLRIIRYRTTHGGPWPQVTYCAFTLGSVVSRAILDLAAGRHVRHVVSVDVHMLTRRRLQRMQERMLWPIDVVRTLYVLRQARRKAVAADTAVHTTPELSAGLRMVIEAAEVAPRTTDVERWKVRPVNVKATTAQEMVVDVYPALHRRVSSGDSEASCRFLLYSLGCVIGSVQEVATLDWELISGEAGAQPLPGVRLRIHALRADGFLARVGLLQEVCTAQRPRSRRPVDGDVLNELEITDKSRGKAVILASDAALRATVRSAIVDVLMPGRAGAAAQQWILRSLWNRANRGALAKSTTARRFHPRMGRNMTGEIGSHGVLVLIRHIGDAPQDTVRTGERAMSAWLTAARARLAVEAFVVGAADAGGAQATVDSLCGLVLQVGPPRLGVHHEFTR
jgi:ThiF family